jgi:hypothetical protein
LTETFAPTWDSNKFVGNPFNFYTYSGIERSVQFNFKVYSLSILEHLAAWERLNFLASLVYPTYGGRGDVYTVPPFLKFTLGNMYRNKECFIDSLIYTVDDNNMWEIGQNSISDTYADLKLPTIIDVGVTLKFVENKSNTNNVKLYGFGKDGTKGTKAPPALGTPGNPVTGTAGPATPIVPTVPTITPVVIPDPPIAPITGLDGSIVKNPSRRTIEEITKENADNVFNKKLISTVNIQQQIQAPPPSTTRKVDVSTEQSITKQDDSGTTYQYIPKQFYISSPIEFKQGAILGQTKQLPGGKKIFEMYIQGDTAPWLVSDPSLTEDAAFKNLNVKFKNLTGAGIGLGNSIKF